MKYRLHPRCQAHTRKGTRCKNKSFMRAFWVGKYCVCYRHGGPDTIEFLEWRVNLKYKR